MESRAKKYKNDLREWADLVSVLVLYDFFGNCTVVKLWIHHEEERGEDSFLVQIGQDRGMAFREWGSFCANRGELRKLANWLRSSTPLDS